MRNRNLRFYIETGRLRYSIDKPRQTAFVTSRCVSAKCGDEQGGRRVSGSVGIAPACGETHVLSLGLAIRAR
jgi:hypothetical protein